MMYTHEYRLSTLVTVTAIALGAPAIAADLHVPSQFPTIQSAINAAQPGDHVRLADGVYTGLGNNNLNFGGKAITVESVNGAAACILDGSSTPGARAFLFDSGELQSSRVQGLTIQGFLTNVTPGAIRLVGSGPQINDCVFRSCSTAVAPAPTPPGSAIVLIDCSPQVNRCRFEFNEGSCIHTDADSVVYLIQSVYEDNVARVTDGRGGAAVLNEGFTLTFNSFYRRNRVEAISGAAYGGAFAHLSGSLDLTNAVFEANEVVGNGPLGGAAVYAKDETVINGGPVRAHDGTHSGGVIHVDASDATDPFLVFASAEYTDGTVGAIRIVDPHGLAEVRVATSVFCGNAPYDIDGPFVDWGSNSVCCPADLNATGTVDFADILDVLANWGPCAGCPADINEDGAVSFADVLSLIGTWGACPTLPPSV